MDLTMLLVVEVGQTRGPKAKMRKEEETKRLRFSTECWLEIDGS
jgi:hypothetical protein